MTAFVAFENGERYIACTKSVQQAESFNEAQDKAIIRAVGFFFDRKQTFDPDKHTTYVVRKLTSLHPQ